MGQNEWYRTPKGIMRQLGPVSYKGERGHNYADREERVHSYPDTDVTKTRKPTWARRMDQGFEAREAGRR